MDPLESDRGSVPTAPGLLLPIAAGIITVVMWRIPYGNYVVYPFSILATWFHEMGHGLCALALGGSFDRLVIFSDASGTAFSRGPLAFGRFGRAFVAGAGPVGPAVAGALLMLLAGKQRRSRLLVGLLACIVLVSVLVWIRSMFGVVFMTATAIALLATAVYGSELSCRAILNLLAIQACVSAWRQFDYLFTERAEVGGELVLSDSGQIAAQLLLPYWFWGGAMTLAIGALTLGAVWAALPAPVDRE